jgi:integrase
MKDGKKRYHAAIWVELPDGSKKQLWKAFDLKKDADSFLDDKSKENREGEYFEPVKITFETFAREWMAKYPGLAGLKPSTVSAYNCVLEKHLIAFFGNMRLGQIKPATIEKDFKSVLPATLSGKSQRNILLVLQRMLRSAVQWEYIRTSPFQVKDRITLPAAKKEKHGRALKPEEITKLLEKCHDEGYTAIALAILSGLRRGEIFGLKWSDIDFEKNQISVNRALFWKLGKVWKDEEKGYLFVEPKSKTSIRKVDMGQKLRRVLLEHRLRSPKSDLDLVFCSPAGTPINPDNFARDFWRPAVKAADIGEVRFHDLRHTFGSLKIQQGENIYYVMRQMGHSSIQMTIDTYTHLLKETNPEAAAKTDEMIFGTA